MVFADAYNLKRGSEFSFADVTKKEELNKRKREFELR